MTRRAAGSGRGIPRAWFLTGLAFTALLGASAGGVLSRSLVLDLAAWWPVWLAFAVLVVAGRHWRIGRVRLSGLIPLLTLAVLAVFVVGHLQGWPVMPSASARLVGPAVGTTTQAKLSARVDGVIRIGSGSGFLYEVGPVRRGGDITIPDSVERSQGDSMTVVLSPPDLTGFYRFAGWDIRLSAEPLWALHLEGDLDADLTRLELSDVALSGHGVVVMGPPSALTPMAVNGQFELVVTSGTPVRVVGDATVPEGWEQLTDGWKSPAAGEGWVITLSEGSSLLVTEG